MVQAQVTAYSAGDAAAILRRELRTHFKGPNHEMHIFPNEPRVQNLILICNPSDLKKMRSTPPREIVDADDGLDLSL